jgi:hypothetical protein
MIDRLLGTHLVERELARRQLKIERLVARIEAVNRDLDVLAEDLVFYQLVLCLIELKARSERDDLDDWLRFASQDDADEPLLDSAIECLVKPRLASIDVEPSGLDNYIYCLHPDWAAIIARLNGTAVARELLAWLREQT